MSNCALSCDHHVVNTSLLLPSSKSESNRALVLHHLSKGSFKVSHVSTADDTQRLKHLLKSIASGVTLDCGPAGTTFRFLTAVLAFTKGAFKLTGSPRMKERPIKDLIDALILLGAEITYLEKAGYPPIQIKGVVPTNNKTVVSVENSSQYLSSLLLVGGFLPQGLTINTTGQMGSAPYINMTMALLAQAGIMVEKTDKTFIIPPQVCKPTLFHVESDWSGASYWFSRLALSTQGEITLLGLKEDSLQGDAVVKDIYLDLGVGYRFVDEGLKLFKTNRINSILTVDFTHCPDLAQTVMATCAVLGVKGLFSGLKSLRIKETDRILAMQTELKKLGASLTTQDDVVFNLAPSSNIPSSTIHINTYDDHRMAMAFAPLAAQVPHLIIENPAVVSKSYPHFWDDLKKTGIQVV